MHFLIFLFNIYKIYTFCSKNIFVLMRTGYEMAHLYTARFRTIRENFEIDSATDPEDLSTERGKKKD